MDSPARICLLVFTMQAVILCAVRARAQENYEFQVYGSDLVAPKHTMLELDSNFTIDDTKTTADGLYPTSHAQHETAEITHGFNGVLRFGWPGGGF